MIDRLKTVALGFAVIVGCAWALVGICIIVGAVAIDRGFPQVDPGGGLTNLVCTGFLAVICVAICAFAAFLILVVADIIGESLRKK